MIPARATILLPLSVLCVWYVQAALADGIKPEHKAVFNELRAKAHGLATWKKRSETEAQNVIQGVYTALSQFDPVADKESLLAWYHGHHTLFMAHAARRDGNNAYWSLDVAKEMLVVAEKALLPALKTKMPDKYLFALQDKAAALLEVAVYAFKSGKPEAKRYFAQSLEVLEEGLLLAKEPIEKARFHDLLALHHEEAAESHLAADGPEGITPRTLKEHCGQSAQVAVSQSRMAVFITREHHLDSALAFYRCNLARRLDDAHYWRTNRTIASDSDEYIEALSNIEASLPWARAHPDDPNAAQVIEYHEDAKRIPGMEAKERQEWLQKMTEPLIYKPAKPWWIKDYQ